MTLCSWDAGWRSALLRAYDEPIEVEEIITAPTADQLIVLVTRGACDIEGNYAGHWQRAGYRAGDIGMTAPGEEVRLRWRGEQTHSTLQLHLPGEMIGTIAAELIGGPVQGAQLPNQLRRDDPLIRETMLAMERAVHARLPDLYADTAAHFLAAHILMHHAQLPPAIIPGRENARMSAVDAYLHEHLASQISLGALAAVAGLSKFHFLRVFKRTYGETPVQRLTRLRIEDAKRRLRASTDSVTEISFACGYENPSHFAAAFRRLTGVAPQEYRRAR
jgi:AraC family transcriptional regulator